MRQVLKLDPGNEEAAEVLWRTEQKARLEDDRKTEERVEALLKRAAAGSAEETQQALAELAILAPGHPKVEELLRTRKQP
jgi:hypothetical protein